MDVLALLTSRGAAQALTILVGLLLVWVMAAPVFGAYSLAMTTIGLAGVIGDAGLDPILTRNIAAQGESALPLLRRAIAIRIALGAAITAALVGIAVLIPTPGRPDLLLIGGLALIPRGIMRAIAAAQTGVGRVREAARLEGYTALLTALLTVLLIAGSAALPGDPAAAAIGALGLGGLAGLALAARQIAITPLPGAQKSSPAPAITSLLAAALPFLILGLSGAAFQSLDVYVVREFYWRPGDTDAVALFSAPYRIVYALLMVPAAWGVVALPRYVRYARRPAILTLALRRDLWRGLGMGLALSGACIVLAAPLTRVALGEHYLPGVPILIALSLMALAVCPSTPLIALLTATGHQARITLCVLIAGGLALTANLLIGLAAPLTSPTLDDLVGRLVVVALIKTLATGLLFGLYLLALPRPLLRAGRLALTARAHRGSTLTR